MAKLSTAAQGQANHAVAQNGFRRVFLVAITLLFLINLVYAGWGALQKAIEDADRQVVNSVTASKKNLDKSNYQALVRYNDSLAFTDRFRATYNRIQQVSGGYYTFGEVAQDIYANKNGRLTYICRRQDVQPMADAITAFSTSLEAQGIPFLYLQAPHKLLYDQNDLVYRINDYANLNANRLLHQLDHSGVDSFDLRTVLTESDRSISPLFFQTDSRWQIRTALDAYFNLIPLVNNRYQLGRAGLDRFGSSANFAVNRTDNCFLGNQGVAAGLMPQTPPDGFDRITPYARTEFSVEITQADGQVIKRTGDFENALMTKKAGLSDLYESYLGQLAPLTRITNHNIDSGERLMILSDELAPPMAAFASLGFSHTTLVTPALYNGSIAQLIKAEKPSLVIVMYQPKSFETPDNFNFA